jgi:Arc/MetJ-type ribon-helix-helix transcriptional regulator
MKRKLSVTIEEDKIEQIETHVNKGIFRNKSHLIEFAIEKFLEDQ